MGKRWTNFLSNFAPEYALKIDIAKARIGRLRSQNKDFIDRFLDGGTTRSGTFGAVSGDRMRYDILGSSKSPDSAISGDSEKLRADVRSLEFNNGNVAGPIKRIVENVVGRGITPQCTVTEDDNRYQFPRIGADQAKEFVYFAEKGWKEWAKIADAKLNQNIYEQQALIEGAIVRDGEALAVFRNSNRRSRLVLGRQIPLCIELLEIDRLKTPMEEINNPFVREGIKYDSEGVKLSYFVMKWHPGDTINNFLNAHSTIPVLQNMEEIPAWDKDGTPKVLHLYDVKRPEQTRGYSQLASGLKDYQDLDRYMEAEKLAALEDACMTGIVETSAPSTFAANYTKPSGKGDYSQIHEFAPNMIHYLNPGEKFDIHGPQRPNSAFGQFIKQLGAGPANGMNIPPEVANQDWQGMNYSNARTVLLQFYLTCRIRQQYLVDHFCYWAWVKLINQFVIKGIVDAPGYADRKTDYQSQRWVPPGWSWVDPVKEAKGKEIEIDMTTDTLTDICAGKGRDVDEVIDTRARELLKIKEAEEKYGVKFPEKSTSESTDGDEDTDTEDENENRTGAGARTLLSVV